jgi:hypothetical protein
VQWKKSGGSNDDGGGNNDGDGDSNDYNAEANANNSLSMTATRTTLLGCASRLETARLPWPSVLVAVTVRKNT